MLNLHRLWTRSLRLRAVLLTGLFTLLGTGLVASFLISQVTDGFFQERFEQVETEATSGLGYVRSSLDTLPSTETTAVNDYVTSTFSDISGRRACPGRRCWCRWRMRRTCRCSRAPRVGWTLTRSSRTRCGMRSWEARSSTGSRSATSTRTATRFPV
ncbi:hypothetical protein [Nesterenkonia pannonica]|uniref:hypothetical protein n=1 Tax=Nesterenkonia pannonica TaxID=1548602 RepID=UPI002164125E|nr:hypothetical protein [Nesterenkonia pannonica]